MLSVLELHIRVTLSYILLPLVYPSCHLIVMVSCKNSSGCVEQL